LPESSYTVLGATGFVGSRIVATLQKAGHDVYTPGREELEQFSRPLGKVFYCVGLTADYLSRPYDTVEAHVSLLARLLKEAEFDRLVYLSSTRLYDGLPESIASEDVTLQLNPASPRHIYDLSKALGENLCLTASSGRASIARLSCVYDSAPGSPGFLSEWLQRAAREKNFGLDSGTGIVRDYIHLDDVVTALIAILESEEKAIFNVASGENVSNATLAEIFNRHGWSVTLDRDTPLQKASVCDISRLQRLGVQPRLVKDVVDQYLELEHA
jgi:nucleoside-diphosphate-sugar epimerase